MHDGTRAEQEDEPRSLRLHAVARDVRTLGPAGAAVIWMQGCGLACPGCMSVETWDPRGGRAATVGDVAAWVIATGSADLVISGGEPAEQAVALAALVDRIRAERDVTVTLYSGFLLAELRADVRPGAAALVDRADLVVDGRYVRALHAPLRWRGSANQQVHDLTGRAAVPPGDEPAGVAVVVSPDGTTADVIGVPSTPGFAAALVAGLRADGIPVEIGRTPRGPQSFPFPTFEENLCPAPRRPDPRTSPKPSGSTSLR